MNARVEAFFDPATFTYSYVVSDPETRQCALIDSVLDYDPASGRTSHAGAERLVDYVREHDLKVQWLLETHVHADHLSAAPYLKQRLGGTLAIGDQIIRLIELHRLISGYEFGRSVAYERTRHLDQLSAVLREGRLADGREVDSRRYLDLIREAASLRVSLVEAFKGVDILVSPSAAGPAPASLESTGDAVFSAAWSLAGNPVITLPLFQAEDTAMPIGCQLVAGFGEDEKLLNVSKSILTRFQA